MSLLQGRKFLQGALAAGVTQAFASSIQGLSSQRFSIERIGAAAAVGGTVSAITGGRFSNGAVTGAFSRMFNDEVHHSQERVLNSSGDAVDHYFNGNGDPAALSDAMKQKIMNHPNV